MSAAMRSFFGDFVILSLSPRRGRISNWADVPFGDPLPSARLRMTNQSTKLNPLRVVRKHRIALIALAVYHFIFFFPTLFMHRVPSPNDVFFNYNPWAAVRPTDVQNAPPNDPPTAYYTLMSLLRSDWRAFHWNPFVACGIPGFGSSAAA